MDAAERGTRRVERGARARRGPVAARGHALGPAPDGDDAGPDGRADGAGADPPGREHPRRRGPLLGQPAARRSGADRHRSLRPGRRRRGPACDPPAAAGRRGRRPGRRARPPQPAGSRAGGGTRRLRLAARAVRLRRRGSHTPDPHLPGDPRARRGRPGGARDRGWPRAHARGRDRARARRADRVRRRRHVRRCRADHVERIGRALAGGAAADHRARPGARRPRPRPRERPRGRAGDGCVLGLRDAGGARAAGGRAHAGGGRPRCALLARVRRAAVRGLGWSGAADRQRRHDRAQRRG